MFVNTFDGGWIVAAGHEHDGHLANFSQPPGSLYSFAASLEANVNQGHIRVGSHGQQTRVSVARGQIAMIETHRGHGVL